MDKIKIEVTTSFGWATKGEIHEVNNYVCFNWGNEPHFEVGKGYKGIALSHCRVLSKIEETPEYTMEELFEKMGHEFKIRGWNANTNTPELKMILKKCSKKFMKHFLKQKSKQNFQI